MLKGRSAQWMNISDVEFLKVQQIWIEPKCFKLLRKPIWKTGFKSGAFIVWFGCAFCQSFSAAGNLNSGPGVLGTD